MAWQEAKSGWLGGKLCWDKGAWQNRSEKKMQRKQKVCCCRIFLGGCKDGLFFWGGEQKIGKQQFFWAASLVGDMFFHSRCFLKVMVLFLVIGCFLLSFSREGIEVVYTLPKTYTAPENGWLGDNPFLLGWPIFGGELLVSGRAGGM